MFNAEVKLEPEDEIEVNEIFEIDEECHLAVFEMQSSDVNVGKKKAERKSPKGLCTKRKFKYSEDAMARALLAVSNGLNVNQASKQFKVPRSTLLRYKSTGRSPMDRKMGPAPVFGNGVESYLTDWVRDSARLGFPVTRDSLRDSAQQIAREMKLKTPFREDKPGIKWMALFLRRHPDIASLLRKRSTSTQHKDDAWFARLEECVERQHLWDAFTSPARVFNIDDISFGLCPESDRVAHLEGRKTLADVSDHDHSLTVLSNVAADGSAPPTMVIYPSMELPEAKQIECPKDWFIGKSENGCLTSGLLLNYFVYFHKWLVSNKVAKPVVVFLDGASPHVTYRLTRFCVHRDIFLVALYSGAVHPIELAVYKPLAAAWDRLVARWKNKGINLSRSNFAEVLKIFIDVIVDPRRIAESFQQCGFVPFDKRVGERIKVHGPKEEQHLDDGVLAKIKKRVKKYLKMRDRAEWEELTCKQMAVEEDFEKVERLVENQKGVESTEIGPERGAVEKHLEYLERFIEPQTLVDFRNCYDKSSPFWTGSVTWTELYNVWMRIKDQTVVDDSCSKSGEESPSQSDIKSPSFSSCDEDEIVDSDFIQDQNEHLSATREDMEFVFSVIC